MSLFIARTWGWGADRAGPAARALVRLLVVLLVTVVTGQVVPAQAAAPLTDAQRAEMERVRAEVADQIQLSAYDLVDELVAGWLKTPVFDKPTPVVLAGVTVPVGLGTGMAALVENHLSQVVLQNPSTNVELVYCPSCTAVMVRSGPEATVISRGLDDPQVLAELGGDTGRHLLFVDIEAEGTWLVLRARLTRLTPDLPIVWSHTLASSASSPSLLRQPQALKSVEQAHQEYLDALRARGPVSVPVRFGVRTYADPNGGGIAPPPFLWLQTGLELGTTDARAWTTSLLLGYSLVPQAYQGVMIQARVHRLITGQVRSLTRPNLYAFVGGTVITVWGAATAPFNDNNVLNADTLLTLDEGTPPRTRFGALHFGLDLRVGERIGYSAFLETMPTMRNNANIGTYILLVGLPFQCFGTEVSFWF